MYYLKYRPKNFSELIGLEDVAGILTNALTKKQISHANIFTGPKGSGKTSTARIMAKALNCENLGKDGEPCNKCASCVAVNEGRFLDLIEIDAASNRGIDDIRELREKIKLAPSLGHYKVYIIDEVHMLTTEAFNALLKTLEEPPAHAVFILATTEYQKIPETIKSRCQIVRFRRGKKQDLIKKLSLICQREGVKVSKEDLALVADLSEGGFRNAETLLEQVAVGGLTLDKFNYSSPEFINFLATNQQKEALEFIDHIAEAGENVSTFNQGLISYLRHLILILGGVGDDVLDIGEEKFKAMKTQAEKFGKEKIIYLINRFIESEDQAKYSSIPQLPLELAVFDIVLRLSKEKIGGNEDTEAGGEDDEELLESNKGDTAVGGNSGPAGVLSKGTGSPKIKSENLSLDVVKERWDALLKAVRPYNHSLEALLRSCRPRDVSQDGTLQIEVFYRFHKDRLSVAGNADILRNVMASVFGCSPDISYILVEKQREVAIPRESSSGESEDIVTAALAAFGA